MSSRHSITNKAGKSQASDIMPVCLQQNHSVTRLNQDAQDGRMNGIDLSSNQQLPTNNLQVKSVNSIKFIRLVVDSLIRLVVKPTTYNLQPSTSNQQLLSPLSSLLVFLLLIISNVGRGQTTLFSDNFNTNNSATWSTSGAIGTYPNWNLTRSGVDWAARVNTSRLELTNDINNSSADNQNGWVFGYRDINGLAGWNTTLANNSAIISWEFNMRQIRTDPAGFGAGSYGVAFVLAGTSATAGSAGSGYAVVLGQSGSTDNIRLVSFQNGLQGTLNAIIAGSADFGNEYLSIRVTYTPCNHEWQLFVRDDGTTDFTDPTSGTLISQGTASNNTFTSTVGMRYIGGYWQGSTGASQTAFFDNIFLKTTPIVASATLTASNNNLNCLNYVLGSGSSFSKISNISGCFLSPATGNITVTPPANFQVSSDNITFSNSLNLAYSNNSLSLNPIYVRMVSGLPAGSYSGNLTITGGGAPDLNIPVGGTVKNETPVSSLQRGDLAIVSVNANNGSCSGVNTQDEISILLLKPIANGLALDLTDNGWERTTANRWGNSEGTVRFTRTGGPLPSGTIITIRAGGTSAPSVVAPDNAWSVTNLNTLVSFPNFALDLNSSGDQLYIMQGGIWNSGTTSLPGPTYNHDATYTGGNVLFGFNTRTTWAANTTTQQSNLYPGIRCFSMMPGAASDFLKYTGPLTDATQRTWIDRINTLGNWTSYGSCSSLNAASPDYRNNGVCWSVTPGGFNAGNWVGSTSTDWFDCENWENLLVPDATTNVTIENGVRNAAVASSPFAPDFNNLAVAQSITMDNAMELTLGPTTPNTLTIGGNMTLNGSSRFNNGNGVLNLNNNGSLTFNATSGMNGGTGTTNIQGNFTAASTAVITPSSGTFNFIGSSTQTITNGHVNPVFNNLTINNSSALGVTLAGSAQLQMNGLLTLQDGLFNTSLTNLLTLTSNATCPSGGSDASFVNGPMRKIGLDANQVFNFPVGKPITVNGSISTGGYRFLGITNAENQTITDEFTCEFFPQSAFSLAPTTKFDKTQTPSLKNISGCEYWQLDGNAGSNPVKVTLSWNSKSKCNNNNYVTNINSLVVAKGAFSNDNNICTWSSVGRTSTNGVSVSGTVTSENITSFSPFALGTTSLTENPLPIKLLYFRAVAKGEQVALSWQVADNHEALSYVLERSRNGVQFEHLKTVAPIPNEELASYQSYDEQPWQGINYYRLRITDIFGKVIYSSIQKVNIEHAQAVSLRISPNPAKDRLLILLSQPEKINELNIVNSVGQTLFKQSKLQSTNPVDISSLRPGIYYVRIIGQAGMQMESFVKE